MEKRHDIQASIAGREPQAVADVAGGSAEVLMAEQNHLRARRCSGSVEHQGDVVRASEVGSDACGRLLCRFGNMTRTGVHRRAGFIEIEQSRRIILDWSNPGDANSARSGYFNSGGIHSLLDHERPGVQIGEIEFNFGGAIGGVERRGHSAASNGEKCHCHLRPVGEDNRHFVAAADALRGEAGHDLLHLGKQPPEGQGCAP